MRQWQSYSVSDVRNPKILTHCIYCPGLPDGEEHWLPRSFGAFRGNSLLKGRICKECNVLFGHTLDQELIRTGHTGMTRQLLGISGRSGQPLANVFEYKAAQLERPIEAESASIIPGQITPIQAVGRSPDGTLKAVQQRTLTIATLEGERILVFPRAWGAKQLRDAAAARGLLGGKVIQAHAAPPETATEFVAASLDVIREVFGSGDFDIYQTKFDAPVGETEYRGVRFNISREYVRAIAKLAFHYFLWTCPWIGGDESEFEGIRRFVRDGNGEEREFFQRHKCLVDRSGVKEGANPDCHMFAAFANDHELLVTLHFFSQSAGPEFPSFGVRLGTRPEPLPSRWHRGHIAQYCQDIPGHAGELRHFTGQSE
jgi:hypothetical protein